MWWRISRTSYSQDVKYNASTTICSLYAAVEDKRLYTVPQIIYLILKNFLLKSFQVLLLFVLSLYRWFPIRQGTLTIYVVHVKCNETTELVERL